MSNDDSIQLCIRHHNEEYSCSLGMNNRLIVVERSFNESKGLNVRVTLNGFLVTPYDTPTTEQLKDDAILWTINANEIVRADISFVRHEDTKVVHMIKRDLVPIDGQPKYLISERKRRFRKLLTGYADSLGEPTEIFEFNYDGIHVSPMDVVDEFAPKLQIAESLED